MFLYRLFSDHSLRDVNIDFLRTVYSKQAENVHIISNNSAGMQQLPEFFIATKCYNKKRPNL